MLGDGNEMIGNGIWGQVTSSVDWCEANYIHSPYIAEMFNTLSSLLLVLAGEFGARCSFTATLHQRISFHLLSIVGIGSGLFHMTLKYETQMLDELPMLWCSAALFYTSLTNEFGRLNKIVPIIMGTITIIATLTTAFTEGFWQKLLFRSTFISVIVASLILTVKFNFSHRNNPQFSKLSRRGWIIFNIGAVAWIIDNTLCPQLSTLPVLKLHAVWHATAALGIYYLAILGVLINQSIDLDHPQGMIPTVNRPHLHYLAGIIPFLTPPNQSKLV